MCTDSEKSESVQAMLVEIFGRYNVDIFGSKQSIIFDFFVHMTITIVDP